MTSGILQRNKRLPRRGRVFSKRCAIAYSLTMVLILTGRWQSSPSSVRLLVGTSCGRLLLPGSLGSDSGPAFHTELSGCLWAAPQPGWDKGHQQHFLQAPFASVSKLRGTRRLSPARDDLQSFYRVLRRCLSPPPASVSVTSATKKRF